MLLINQSQDFLKKVFIFLPYEFEYEKEARLFNLMKNLRKRWEEEEEARWAHRS
mgnify:CR=1 FL=1